MLDKIDGGKWHWSKRWKGHEKKSFHWVTCFVPPTIDLFLNEEVGRMIQSKAGMFKLELEGLVNVRPMKLKKYFCDINIFNSFLLHSQSIHLLRIYWYILHSWFDVRK